MQAAAKYHCSKKGILGRPTTLLKPQNVNGKKRDGKGKRYGMKNGAMKVAHGKVFLSLGEMMLMRVVQSNVERGEGDPVAGSRTR
jgi:hypothetical protein